MAVAFVSVIRGSDSTGDGSAATPWKTIGKAVGGTPAFTLDSANPNFLYIEPGVYREAVPIGVSPTSSGPLAIVGDGDGAGFLGGGHSSPTTGVVDWRAWSDDHTPITSNCLVVSGKSYLTVKGVKFIGGDIDTGVVSLSSTHDVTIQDCNFISYCGTNKATIISTAPTAGVPPNLTVERCEFWTLTNGGAGVSMAIPLHSADWSLGSTIRNCTFSGAATGVFVSQSGSGTYNGGGLAIQNCTFRNAGYGFYAYITSGLLSNQHSVNGCEFLGCALHAEADNQVVEDGNLFATSTANDHVAAGTHSVFAACPAFSLNDERLGGGAPRPHGEPSATSPFNAFGNYGTAPTVDLWGKTRPATASAGAIEIDDFPSGGGDTFIFQTES